jgi:hypothetical protein
VKVRRGVVRVRRAGGFRLGAIPAVVVAVFACAGALAHGEQSDGEEAARATARPAPAAPARLVRELPAQRTRTSRTYLDARGARVVRIWPGAVNYRDARGRWRAIDDVLRPRPGGGFTAGRPGYRVRLPEALSAGPVRIARDGARLDFRLRGAAGMARRTGAGVRYRGALPGVDVRYVMRNEGLKEDLVLRGPRATRSFVFDVSTSRGVALRRRPGGVLAVRRRGERLLVLDRPFLRDAAGAISDDVRVVLAGRMIGLVPSARWLDAPERRWPVVLDPSAAPTPTRDCLIQHEHSWPYGSGGGGGSGESARMAARTSSTMMATAATTNASCAITPLRVGGFYRPAFHDRAGHERLVRALLHFDVAGAVPADAQVTSAALGLFFIGQSGSAQNTEVRPLTKPWNTSVTWTAYDGVQPWTTAGGDVTGASSNVMVDDAAGVNRYIRWPVTDHVRAWVGGTLPNHGFRVSAGTSGESNFNSAEAAANRPYLEIVYGLDATQPSLALSGSLYNAAGTQLEAGDYELRIVADDGAPPAASGLQKVEVFVDNVLRPTIVRDPNCPGTPTQQCHVFTYTGDAFTPGPHEIKVVATDMRGNARTQSFIVYGHEKLSPTAVAVGFEEHFALRSLARAPARSPP